MDDLIERVASLIGDSVEARYGIAVSASHMTEIANAIAALRPASEGEALEAARDYLEKQDGYGFETQAEFDQALFKGAVAARAMVGFCLAHSAPNDVPDNQAVAVVQALGEAAAYLDGYAGGHYMAQSCATVLRERAAMISAAPSLSKDD